MPKLRTPLTGKQARPQRSASSAVLRPGALSQLPDCPAPSLWSRPGLPNRSSLRVASSRPHRLLLRPFMGEKSTEPPQEKGESKHSGTQKNVSLSLGVLHVFHCLRLSHGAGRLSSSVSRCFTKLLYLCLKRGSQLTRLRVWES